MGTYNKTYPVTSEEELSDLLNEMVKGVSAKYTTPPTESGYMELKELDGSYIVVVRGNDGSTGLALQISAAWKQVFDEMISTQPAAKEHVAELIAHQTSQALEYQEIFLAPQPMPEMPKVTPMISDGTDGYVGGVDRRLVAATLEPESERVFHAYSYKDSRDVIIVKTEKGYFIGSLYDDTKTEQDVTGMQFITYVSPEAFAELQAKYGSGSRNTPLSQEQEVLEAAIAVVGKARTEQHPVTPHDTIPNEVFWKQSCNLW